MTAVELQSRLQPLLNLQVLQELTAKIILNDQAPLKDKKISEWEKGQRPDGTDIGHYRSKAYELYKYQLNPLAYGTVDLLLTRQTASTLFVHRGSQNGGFIFGMNDTHNLIGRYGKDILGLNKQWFDNRQSAFYRLQLIQEIQTQLR